MQNETTRTSERLVWHDQGCSVGQEVVPWISAEHHACMLAYWVFGGCVWLFVCVRVHVCGFAQGAPADGLALLRFTLGAVNQYFTALGTRKVWLPKQDAMVCVRSCQNFTATWQHALDHKLIFLSGFLHACIHAWHAFIPWTRTDCVLDCVSLGGLQRFEPLRSVAKMDFVQNQAEITYAAGNQAPQKNYVCWHVLFEFVSCLHACWSEFYLAFYLAQVLHEWPTCHGGRLCTEPELCLTSIAFMPATCISFVLKRDRLLNLARRGLHW